MSRTLLSRATAAVTRSSTDRRTFLGRAALTASALVAAPTDFLLRPKTAYAAICNCQGQGCQCGSLCCDGYTEFCCAIYGLNACPTGSITGGWWKADNSSFCGGAARYYMDCHKPCGGCSCGGNGICSGSCNGTPCGCGRGRCDHRKAGCTSFRYGNCSNHIACIGPIQCRVVTCTPPWQLEPSCSSAAVRTDNNTRSHNRPCLQQAPPIFPVTGDWNGTAGTGLGFFDGRTAQWDIRETPNTGGHPVFRYGAPGDRPVVGDWNGDGRQSVGVVRNAQWYLRDSATGGSANYTFRYGVPTDIPVVGDWDGDGRQTPGVFRGGVWHLSNRLGGGSADYTFRFGRGTDTPIVGDWNGNGRDTVGVFRSGFWYFKNSLSGGEHDIALGFGRPDDIPVVGDWHGLGATSIGVYRPSNGTWYLRRSLTDGTTTTLTWGERWLIG